MTVGLNLLYLLPGVVGGTETYATGLLEGARELNTPHTILLFVNREASEWASSSFPDFKTVVCPVNGTNRGVRYVVEQLILPRTLREHRVDLLHSLGYTAPLHLRCPSVVSVHDLNYAAFGNSMPLVRRLVLSFFVKQAILRSTKVITVSEFSRRQILDRYGISPDKIAVTHEAAMMKVPGHDAASAMFPRPYFVAFSSTSPNKNVPNLIRAFVEAKRQSGFPHKLVLLGHHFPLDQDKDLSGLLRNSPDIVQTGYLDRTRLEGILKDADFLAFPSTYEGFGLPILEAMTLGVPVICSDAASLPEVAGGAALFFNPLSVQDIAEKIRMVASSRELRDELRAKGFENVRRFSWRKTAQQTMEVYEQAMLQSRT